MSSKKGIRTRRGNATKIPSPRRRTAPGSSSKRKIDPTAQVQIPRAVPSPARKRAFFSSESNSLSSTVPSSPGSQKAWSTVEDKALYEAIKLHGAANFSEISKMPIFASRHEKTIEERWEKIKPDPIKGPWTEDEDKLLIKLVKRYGPKRWALISQHVPGRRGKQCRERFKNHLDVGVNKSPWTPEEDDLLMEAQGRIGNKWSEIAKLLPGRPENAVKNRWNSLTNRRLPYPRYPKARKSKTASSSSKTTAKTKIKNKEKTSNGTAKKSTTNGRNTTFSGGHSKNKSSSSSSRKPVLSAKDAKVNLEDDIELYGQPSFMQTAASNASTTYSASAPQHPMRTTIDTGDHFPYEDLPKMKTITPTSLGVQRVAQYRLQETNQQMMPRGGLGSRYAVTNDSQEFNSQLQSYFHLPTDKKHLHDHFQPDSNVKSDVEERRKRTTSVGEAQRYQRYTNRVADGKFLTEFETEASFSHITPTAKANEMFRFSLDGSTELDNIHHMHHPQQTYSSSKRNLSVNKSANNVDLPNWDKDVSASFDRAFSSLPGSMPKPMKSTTPTHRKNPAPTPPSSSSSINSLSTSRALNRMSLELSQSMEGLNLRDATQMKPRRVPRSINVNMSASADGLPMLSPVAQQLRQVADNYNEGKITQHERGLLKDDILRRSFSLLPPTLSGKFPFETTISTFSL
eukprot:g1545.t1